MVRAFRNTETVTMYTFDTPIEFQVDYYYYFHEGDSLNEETNQIEVFSIIDPVSNVSLRGTVARLSETLNVDYEQLILNELELEKE